MRSLNSGYNTVKTMVRFKRKRGPVRSKKVTIDGIKFASGLEAYMYRALKKAKIKAVYEKEHLRFFLDFIFQKMHMKDKQMEKVV